MRMIVTHLVSLVVLVQLRLGWADTDDSGVRAVEGREDNDGAVAGVRQDVHVSSAAMEKKRACR